MMTSPSTNQIPAFAPRSVRDLATYQPDLVNEVCCRKIFRQVLQTLEREHALQRPHAPISPDTVLLDEHNDPILIPAEPGVPEPGEAADVQALGMLIHYAITQEEVPQMSLRKRGLTGYSDSLITAVDKCSAPNPAERPQTITELRNLLGIVALGPPTGVPAIDPVYMQAADLPRPRGLAGMSKGARRAVIGIAIVVLLGAASAYWTLLRDASDDEDIVLSLPGAEPAGSAPAEPAEKHGPAPAASGIASAGDTATRTAESGVESQAQLQAHAEPAAPPALAHARTGQHVAAGTTNYKLFIRPWGTVYVNGRQRGVSPPLKVLNLPPGNHTVRVVNPNFRDRIIKVHSISHGSGQIEVDFTD